VGDGPLIILDTHAWMWWLLTPNKLSKNAARAIESAESLGVPAICCLEVAAMVQNREIEVAGPVAAWMQQALAAPRFELVPISPAIAVTAAGLRGSGVTDPADRLIAATTIELQATLVTKDQKLLDFEAVRTVW